MIAAYENSKWEPVKWENDMHCAVKIQDKNQWRRGQIIRMVTDTLVEVNCRVKSIIVKVNAFFIFSPRVKTVFIECFSLPKKYFQVLFVCRLKKLLFS